MAKYVIDESVFCLAGLNQSKRLSVIINSQCKKNAFDVFYRQVSENCFLIATLDLVTR